MIWLLALLACADEKAEDSSAADPGFSWVGGDFWFYTFDVDDGCFEGALRALFMPEGADEPHRFSYLIYLPSYDELPYDEDIDLREPFVEMPVRIVEGAEGQLQIQGSVMDDVLLGERYGGCTVTMTVDADLRPTDADTATGNSEISMSNMNADPLCPVLTSADCRVSLELEARRN
jgi:hypothetical protein